VPRLAIYEHRPRTAIPPALRACYRDRAMKRLLRHPVVQALLARLLGRYLAFALATTRWRLEGAEHLDAVGGAPTIVAFWHRRLPLMPILWLLVRNRAQYRRRRVHVLVSHHADGQFIGNVIRRFKMETVAGSSSRGGAAGLRCMMRLLQSGDLVAITPDGPRGPAGEAAPGTAQLAALADVPVLPCAAQTTRHWALRTWDSMLVPKPFGRGVVVCGPLINVTRKGWADAVPAIGAALTATADLADRLCKA
jgi:lysophospholipid acyltransferase (LPLAT)-like uncharacterized protein